MKKRSRIRVPVTQGMKDIYAMDMHLPYQSACAGKFTVVAFSRLAAAVSVVRYALELGQTKTPQAIPILDAAIAVLHHVRQRGDTTGIWEISESERPSVLEGIQVAEMCIGTLSVAQLEQAADLLLVQLNSETSA
ncbi:hypothetical protein [Ferriphaselus sp. R-1]|uniref:hypothetical protein n=1 Tax=Ferriphaselus sp. R-1 TaxID=1485544 RepID=UPI001267F0B7|nr:hypothetical protein [Ferriphaselus sp. R-1]